MKKRLLSFLCTLALCLGLLPVTVFAATPEGVWTDYVADSFAEGAGTEVDPYQIATAEQLAKLSKDVSEGTSYQGTFFILTENIDLSAHRWTPIGIYKWEENGTTINNSFQGFLDGNDKTISGMSVDERIDHYCGGLFGKISIQTNGSPVGAKDLTITGATVYVDETGLTECSGAILAGNVMGSDTQSVVFENITVSGSVYVTRTNGNNKIGGMLGCASWVKATDCHADGVSISGASNCGGFVGNDSGSVYENCTASGMIDGAWALGGFVGYSTSAKWQDPAGASTYTKCSADVDVSGNDWRVGGFVGFAEYGQFNNCVAYGDVTSIVTGWEPKVGGFAGEDSSNVNITACHAVGVVTGASSDYQAGGFIGTYSGGTFTGCSFDSEKNSGLNAAGTGTIASGVTGEDSAVVLANICEDYYGRHQYSSDWTIETEPTCTREGSQYQVCERCGVKGNMTSIPATGHTLIKTEAKEPTCTADGNTVYWTCENCEKVFGDETGETETSLAETVVQATGHNYVNGICTKCGAVLSQPAPQPSGPSTGNSNGWTEIEEEVTETPSGSTLAVDMNGTTDVPAKMFETLAGKDVTLELDMGSGVSWTVNGQDIPADTDFADLDLGVKLNTSGIPVDVINIVTGEKGAVQLTLAHNGEFGFTLTLTAPLGTENKGLWANLYHYNTTQKRMLFETAAKVDANGNVSLPFTHASEYAIVLDEKSHELPFTDVADGDWFQAAVEYVYCNDIMTGTSGTTFEPSITLSRAMVAQILYNLEGQPDISDENLGYPYSDVDAEAWYGDAVYWARLNGVATGYEDNTFRPDKAVSREELAQMLYNYAKYQEIIVPAVGDLSRFPDGDKVSLWAKTAMKWATGLGVINGYEDSTLRPDGNTTRAEAASIILGMATTLIVS